jgi:hypothetical protein
MPHREKFWKLPRKFAWGLPLVAAGTSGLVYVVFHSILRVPQEMLFWSELAFSGITVMFIILIFWAIEYRISHDGDIRLMIVVVCGYFVSFNLLAAHYMIKLDLLAPRDAFGSVTVALVLFFASMLFSILRRSRQTARGSRGERSPEQGTQH